jgi:hypothetical protein
MLLKPCQAEQQNHSNLLQHKLDCTRSLAVAAAGPAVDGWWIEVQVILKCLLRCTSPAGCGGAVAKRRRVLSVMHAVLP